MSWSLNEVEVAAKKAARGAGYSWGMSEEAGKATRWLCARNIDGCAALARLLDQTDGVNLKEWTPIVGSDAWMARGGKMCPLIAGAAISDHACALLVDNLRIGTVIEPIFLTAFAALAAQELTSTLTLTCSGSVASTDGDLLSIKGVLATECDLIILSKGGDLRDPMPRRTRAESDPDSWKTINRFAHRTYAPATDQSRLSGAGAGVSDND